MGIQCNKNILQMLSSLLLSARKTCSSFVAALIVDLSEELMLFNLLCFTLLDYVSVVEAADLVRSIHPVPTDLEMDFLRISSYVGTQSSGNGTMAMQSRLPVKNRHVLVVSSVQRHQLGRVCVTCLEHDK